MATRVSDAVARHGYLTAVLAIALSTAVFLTGRDLFAKGQWALLYLLIILLVAGGAGAGPAVFAAVLAFFTWNFFFLPPYHTLQVHDAKDLVALAAFLVVGIIVGIQTGRMREREARAVARERETAALNRLSAAIVSQTSTDEMAESCLAEVVELLGAGGAVLFVREGDELLAHRASPTSDTVGADVAESALRILRCADTTVEQELSPAQADDEALNVAVRSPSGVLGVLTVLARPKGQRYSEADEQLVASLANLVGAFLERERLQAAAAQ